MMNQGNGTRLYSRVVIFFKKSVSLNTVLMRKVLIFIKSLSLSKCLFNVLCDYVRLCKSFPLHTQPPCLPQAKALAQLFESQATLSTVFLEYGFYVKE
jgi:hypothetical protein